jgi:hypothetical protein
VIVAKARGLANPAPGANRSPHTGHSIRSKSIRRTWDTREGMRVFLTQGRRGPQTQV